MSGLALFLNRPFNLTAQAFVRAPGLFSSWGLTVGASPGSNVAYCTQADLKPYIDSRTMATLLSDSGKPLTGDPFTDTVFLPSILLSACGALEAALLVGAKYTAEELASEVPEASRQHMVRIIAGLVMGALRDRRGIVTEKEPQISAWAEKEITKLRNGVRILSLPSVQDARAGMTARKENYQTRLCRPDYSNKKSRFFGIH